MEKRQGVLLDLTQCVGCGSCTVACRLWNELKYDAASPATGPNPVQNCHNWTTVTQRQVTKDGKPAWRFVKRQCMHCLEPACVSACFSKALQKTEQGPVIYHPRLCVGCRYCMVACPFSVPKYEWQQAIPLVSKCQMCFSRVSNGESVACAAVCPTGALVCADRDELLATARDRMAKNDQYVKHIYGEKEAGGTSWLYLSDVPFAALGFSDKIPLAALPRYTEDYLRWTPGLLLGGTALFAALSLYTRRRQAVAQLEAKVENQKTSQSSSTPVDGD